MRVRLPRRLRDRLDEAHRRRIQSRYFDQVVAPNLASEVAGHMALRQRAQAWWQTHLGRDVDTRWHVAYFEKTGLDDPRFLPSHEWYDLIVPHLNNPRMRDTYRDKNLAERFLGDVRMPQDLLRRMHGLYYAPGYRALSREGVDAVLRVADGVVLLKDSQLDNAAGVHCLDLIDGRLHRDGEALSLAQIESEFGRDFVLQKYLRQHPDFAKPHQSSVNCLRVMTLRLDGVIRDIHTYVRFGRSGSITDNTSGGVSGIACRVEPDGHLSGPAMSSAGESFDAHPDSGCRFDEISLPGVAEAQALGRDLHRRVYHMDYVCWDIAMATDARPVLIEMNFRGRPNLMQFVCRRPLLGGATSTILHRIRDASGSGGATRTILHRIRDASGSVR